MIIPRPVKNLIDAFERLPGIGPKTAARLTFYLLHVPEHEVSLLSQAVKRLKTDTVICGTCFNVAEKDPCPICVSPKRERDVLAVVETPLDVLALERAHFKGLYHVLHGVIDPLNNIGPDELKIRELLQRVQGIARKDSENSVNQEVRKSDFSEIRNSGASDSLTHRLSDAPSRSEFSEIILATNPSVEGEATAQFVKRELDGLGFAGKITRLARGLPVGGDLEYADDVTLGRAIEGRTEY